MGNLLNKKVKCVDAKKACPLQSRSQQWKPLSCTCSRKLHRKASAFMAQGRQTCFVWYIKGQLRSLCVLFIPGRVQVYQKQKLSSMKEGSRREAAAGRLTQFTQICHFRSTAKCLPATCLSGDPSLEKWYKSSLCLLQKSTWAFTVLPSLWFTG